MSAAQSNSYEWSILLAANIVFFSLAFGVYGAVQELSFGYYFLFGFIISIVANVIMFGALYIILAAMRKTLPIMSMLNLYTLTTLPLTVAALAAMIFAPMWHVFAVFFIALAVLTQVIMIFIAVQKASGEGRMNISLFMIIMVICLLVLLVSAFFLRQAAFKSSIGDDAYDVLQQIGNYL